MQFLVSYGTSAAVQLALSIALIRWAPIIAGRFYPSDAQAPEASTRFSAGDIYHTVCFVLGAYLLVQGSVSWGNLTVAAFSAGSGHQLASAALTAIVYTASGLLLVLGARRIGQLVSSLKHDPESIPQQQFSLKLLLTIAVLVAVVLGVLRMLAVGRQGQP
jgi:hypothetical protein